MFRDLPINRDDVVVCLIGCLVCIFLQLSLNRITTPDMFDSRQYLGAAYNLAHHGVFNEGPSLDIPSPGLGREPGYGFLLAGLFIIDPALSNVTPECCASH